MKKIATLLLLLTGSAFADPAAYHLGPFLLQGDAGDRGYAGIDFGGRIDW